MEFNEADLTVRYPNGNNLQLFGADNADALRGPGFSGLPFDEYSQYPGNLFSAVQTSRRSSRLRDLRRHHRPPIRGVVREVILRLAREDPRWGYPLIVGELKGMGIAVSATTVRKILRQEHLGPAGQRRRPSWRQFLRAQAKTMVAVDFFTVDTVWLQRVHVLFFIELASRRVHLAGCTPHPDAAWVTQQARQIAWRLADRAEPIRFLLRDHDAKYTAVFGRDI